MNNTNYRNIFSEHLDMIGEQPVRRNGSPQRRIGFIHYFAAITAFLAFNLLFDRINNMPSCPPEHPIVHASYPTVN